MQNAFVSRVLIRLDKSTCKCKISSVKFLYYLITIYTEMYLSLYKYRKYKMDPVRITLLTGLYKGANKSLTISHCCSGDLVERATFLFFF